MSISTARNNFKPLIAILVISLLISMSILVISAKLQYYYLLLLAFGLPVGILVFRALIISSSRVNELFSSLHWWHILWILVFFSGLVLRIRDTEDAQQNPLDIWALYRIALIGIVALVLVARLLKRRTDWFQTLFKGSIGLLTGFAIIGIISTLWSVYPEWTLYKSTEYLIDVALIAAIVVAAKSINDFKTYFDLTWLLIGLLMLSAWIGLIIWPGLYRYDVGMIGLQLGGVIPAMETNKVGELGAILAIVALNRFLFLKDKKFYFIIFLVSIVTLIFSQSRSPITGFLVAVPIMLFAAKKIGPVVLASMMVFSVLLLTGIIDTFVQFFMRGQDPEYFANLSGRTVMWARGVEVLKESPLVGFGAYAGSRFAVLVKLGIYDGSSILNTWLEILLGVGIIGAIFVVTAFFRTWFVIVKSALRSNTGSLTHCLAVEAIGVFALISVRSIFTTVIIWHPPIIFLLVVAYSEYLHRFLRKNRIKNMTYSKSL
ncbi:MAG: O-antigen ligase family protein [Thermodesulfobacteriota bacterium]